MNLEITISGETLTTTLEHPFYTTDGEWINAGDLAIGEEIQSLDGTIGVVESIEVVSDSQPMYNLTVADAHTFFVGDGQWLVHNTDDCDFRRLDRDEARPFKEGVENCYYCGDKLIKPDPNGRGNTRGEASRKMPIAEHIYPLGQAKDNGRAWTQTEWDEYINDAANIIVSCKSCNSSKLHKQLGHGKGEWWPKQNGDEALEIYKRIKEKYAP